MKSLKTACPECGNVQVDLSTVCITYCVDTQQKHYFFTCPACQNEIQKFPTQEAYDLLARYGAKIYILTLPPKPAELLEWKDGELFVDHDAIDLFIDLLDDDNVTAELAMWNI